MSDSGGMSIIDPYRPNPTNGIGAMQGMAQFAMSQEELAKRQGDAALAHATRQYLTRVMGLPEGVDPMTVQQSNGESQRQGAFQTQETRAQGEYDRMGADRQSALNYIDRLPEQEDPALEAFRKAGGVFGAKELAALMGGDYANKGALDARHRMNLDDNIAKASQETDRLTQQREYDLAKEKRSKLLQDEENKRSQAAADMLVYDRDPTGVIGMNPNLSGTPTVGDKIDQYHNRQDADKTAKDNEEDKDKYRPDPGDTGDFQEDPRLPQERINQQFPNMRPIDIIRQTILNTEQLGGDRVWKDVRTKYPEQYDEAWRQRQEELREQKVQTLMEYIRHPAVPANPKSYHGG
jgi:hypothetical protein